MFSFYGNGPQGKNFKIAKVFSNYKALLKDCQASEVRDGDLVIISYGEVGTETYDGNLSIDNENKYGNKNSTLWEKHYYPTDPENSNIVFPVGKTNGWGYRFIAQMTGNTPDISFTIDQTIRPNRDPTIEKTKDSTSDIQIWKIHLQRGSRIWAVDKVEKLTIDNIAMGVSDLVLSKETLELYEVTSITDSSSTLSSLNIKLTPKFNTPSVETVSPNENASVNLNGNGISGYTFNFKIPKGDIGAQGPQGERGLQGDSLVFIGVENVTDFSTVTDSTFASYNPTTTNEVVVVTAGEESRWYFKLNGHWVYTVSSGSSLVWQEL